jgi:hypothetical protein
MLQIPVDDAGARGVGSNQSVESLRTTLIEGQGGARARSPSPSRSRSASCSSSSSVLSDDVRRIFGVSPEKSKKSKKSKKSRKRKHKEKTANYDEVAAASRRPFGGITIIGSRVIPVPEQPPAIQHRRPFGGITIIGSTVIPVPEQPPAIQQPEVPESPTAPDVEQEAPPVPYIPPPAAPPGIIPQNAGFNSPRPPMCRNPFTVGNFHANY